MIVAGLHGLERSGTNYLTWLLMHNFKDLVVIVSGKHLIKNTNFSNRVNKALGVWRNNKRRDIRPIAALDESLIERINKKCPARYILNVKNPYSNFASYIRNIKYIDAGVFACTWVKRNKHWIGLCERNKGRNVIVKYEDLLEGYEKVLGEMRKMFGLNKVDEYISSNRHMNTAAKGMPEGSLNNSIVHFEKKIKSATGVEKRRFQSRLDGLNRNVKGFDKNYYLEEKYLDEIGKDAIAKINKAVPKGLMKSLGYRIVDM